MRSRIATNITKSEEGSFLVDHSSSDLPPKK